ncbi:hypothetical protein B0H15DRAFT_829576 [Mycena belliarum]|uniref:Uncharacterized protein n=1 Tax=Mycena belliarum TaxID=1033014 RepID=A0AAD6U948_9AGAR|nr:hypothetical protein B0H15DRAFT_829576 [Mycena belliae]
MATPDHRLTSSPYASSARQFSIDPATPVRGAESRMSGEFGPGNDSPTSTLESEPASFRFSDSASRSTFRATFTPANGTPSKKNIVRSDPSIFTAFDPADRELYELWAPKK